MPKFVKFVRTAIKYIAILDSVLDEFDRERARRQAK
jgi:hypothetical protein